MKVLNDLLWDGELKIYQDTNKFKFSIDSVLLANFVTINKSTSHILDIGTGNAPIPLMLTKRTNALIDGVEMQNESFLLAIDSVKHNNKQEQITLYNEDINKFYLNMNNNYYDTIISNPPYFKSNMKLSSNIYKKIARSEETLTIKDICVIAKKLLKNMGNIAIVIDTERLVEVINIMKNNSIEPKRIQFVYPKASKNSKIMLIEGTKNGKPGIKILNPIFIQDENDNYTKEIENILYNFGK